MTEHVDILAGTAGMETPPLLDCEKARVPA
jgi:hypothetical protein